MTTTVALGASDSGEFTVTNTGTSSAELSFTENSGSFEILRANGTRMTTQELADAAWGREEDAKEEKAETAEAKGKLRRLHAAAEELATYLRRNAGQIINYDERHRADERISTGFVQSAVN